VTSLRASSGKTIASVVMIVGIGFFAILTGAVARVHAN
jgi:hypothetical protein